MGETKIRSALSVISLAELRITKINILGNKAEIDNPQIALPPFAYPNSPRPLNKC